MRYYLSWNGETNGPHDEHHVKQWARDGQIKPGTMLATEAAPYQWQPFEGSALALASRKGSNLVALLVAIPVAVLFLCGTAILGSKKSGKDSVSPEPAKVESTPEAVAVTKPIEDLSRCLLRAGDGGSVPVFPTEEGMSEFGVAAARGEDDQALAVILASNGGFLVESGTKCSYTDVGIIRSEIRVTEGPHTGRKGWVPAEWARGGR